MAGSLLATGCTPTATQTGPAVIYSGQLDVYLQAFDDKGACSITIGLRNSSGVRQGDANLKLEWFDPAGAVIAQQALRLDGLLDGRYDAKNLALPVRCREVDWLKVRRAEWVLFEGWDSPVRSIVRIDGVEDTEWQFLWDEETGYFIGRTPGG